MFHYVIRQTLRKHAGVSLLGQKTQKGSKYISFEYLMHRRPRANASTAPAPQQKGTKSYLIYFRPIQEGLKQQWTHAST